MMIFDELINSIEKTVSELLQYDRANYSADAQALANTLVAAIPVVINCYNDPGLSDIREDALYWPGQLERIIGALKGGDWFAVADVLYNETRPNLIELRDVMTKRGLL